MTDREWNLIKEAGACTRHELGDRVPPGSQDAHRYRPKGSEVTTGEAAEIRTHVRYLLTRPRRAYTDVFGN